MKPIKFKEQNKVYAENQSPYLPLPEGDKMKILIVALCFIGSLFLAFYLGTLDCNRMTEKDNIIKGEGL